MNLPSRRQVSILIKLAGIALSGGERRNVDANLTVGSTSQTVEISSAVDQVTTVDSGEKSAL